MFRYILRRLMIAVPSLLGISLVLFTVLAMAPGDPFSELVSNPNIPPEVAMALREKFGLNDPLMVRYWNWLTAMVHGDWGYSFISRINVETLIMQRIPVTLLVIGSSQIFRYLTRQKSECSARFRHWLLVFLQNQSRFLYREDCGPTI